MSPAPPPARILVVEDNAAVADLIRRRLTLEGLEPVMCAGGALAKAMLEHDAFAAVLLDIMMPEVDGFEVLRHIRATPSLRALPVVILTAAVSREHRETAHEMGADAYVTKPFSAQGLVNTLRDVLAHAAART